VRQGDKCEGEFEGIGKEAGVAQSKEMPSHCVRDIMHHILTQVSQQTEANNLCIIKKAFRLYPSCSVFFLDM
jgi:hypothetical protein